MDLDLTQPPPNSRRKAFWFGFVLSLGACTLAACMGLIYSEEIGNVARATMTQIHPAPAPTPPAVDIAGAHARLNKAAGIHLAFPFPDPQIILNKAYGELDLFYGARFVKKYKVEGAGGIPTGTYAVTTHQPPPAAAEPLRIGLAGCTPTSATASLRLRAGEVASGAGQMEIVGLNPPTAVTGGTAADPVTSAAVAAPGIPAASQLRLTRDDADEIYAVTRPGTLLVVVDQ